MARADWELWVAACNRASESDRPPAITSPVRPRAARAGGRLEYIHQHAARVEGFVNHGGDHAGNAEGYHHAQRLDGIAQAQAEAAQLALAALAMQTAEHQLALFVHVFGLDAHQPGLRIEIGAGLARQQRVCFGDLQRHGGGRGIQGSRIAAERFDFARVALGFAQEPKNAVFSHAP